MPTCCPQSGVQMGGWESDLHTWESGSQCGAGLCVVTVLSSPPFPAVFWEVPQLL